MPELLGLRAGLLRTTKIFKYDPKYVCQEKWEAELALIDQIENLQRHNNHINHDTERPTNFNLDAVHTTLKHSKDLSKVKSAIRHDQLPVDHDSRTHLWTLLCCGTIEKIVDETFQMYAGKFANVAPEKMLPIDDMDEDMQVHHMLSEEGVRACHRVLYAIAETHPHIQQFSPLLYAFTSAMLHYADEQAAFRCVCELMKRRDVNYFLAPSEININAACFVLKDLAYRYTKSAAVHIERHCPDEDLVSFMSDWILWIFKHLPFHYLVRIIDCYLVEGYKVLFRVALILIKLFHKISAEKSDFMDAGKPEAGIKSMCTEIHKYITCDKLLKDAFGIRGFSKKEIDSLFNKVERDLRNGTLAISIRAHRPSMDGGIATPKPISGKGESEKRRTHAMKSKNVFKLDKDVHTQIILDDINSDILEKHQLLTIWGWLPPAEGVKDPLMVFTTNEHGYSLKTLYEKLEEYGPSILVIRTTTGDIFGAYCGTDWIERHSQIDAGAQISYFGCGQTFVFSISPDRCYPWVGKETPVTLASASMFQAGDRNILMIGGGNGVALQIDKDLDYGRTEHCDTFENEPLSRDEEFRVQTLEAYVFTS